MNQFFTGGDQFALNPAIMLALFGCATLLFDLLLSPDPKQRKWLLGIVVVGLGFAGVGLLRQQMYLNETGQSQLTAFQGALTIDRFALFFKLIETGKTFVVLVALSRANRDAGPHLG